MNLDGLGPEKPIFHRKRLASLKSGPEFTLDGLGPEEPTQPTKLGQSAGRVIRWTFRNTFGRLWRGLFVDD